MTPGTKQIIDAVATELNVQPVEISLRMRLEDLGVDSLNRLSLAIRLEESHGVILPDMWFSGCEPLKTSLSRLAAPQRQRDPPRRETVDDSQDGKGASDNVELTGQWSLSGLATEPK